MQAVSAVTEIAKTSVVFMLMITLLVAVHELGHYLAARMFGMKVNAFAVMVGGIRKTDLTAYLQKPLVPASRVAVAYIGTGLIAAFASAENQALLFNVALAALALPLPIWVASRLAAIYQMRPVDGMRYPLMASAAGIAMLVFSRLNSLAKLTATDILMTMAIASLLGLLILYYAPISKGKENSEEHDDHELEHMGRGNVVVRSEQGAVDVPVRFRPIWHWTNKEGTEFSMLALPLGGFVRIRGMHPRPDGSETQIDGGFYSKSAWARFVVLFAGPIFSILLGAVLFFSQLAFFGMEKLTNEPIIGMVGADGPASKAGLKAGDKIVSLDGKPVTTFFDVVSYVRERDGQSIKVIIERDGKPQTISVTPELGKVESPVLGPDMQPTEVMKKQAKLGIAPSTKLTPISLGEAVRLSAGAPLIAAQMFGNMIKRPDQAKENLGGPGTIAAATHNATRNGLYDILGLAASLSISLGFMNLLPVPPLDGGQMTVALVEMLRRGKRLSIEVQQAVSTVGFVLVMMLMFFVLSQDIGRAVR